MREMILPLQWCITIQGCHDGNKCFPHILRKRDAVYWQEANILGFDN